MCMYGTLWRECIMVNATSIRQTGAVYYVLDKIFGFTPCFNWQILVYNSNDRIQCSFLNQSYDPKPCLFFSIRHISKH